MKTRLLTPGVSLFALSTSLCSLILLFACLLCSSCRSSSGRSGDGETGGDLPLYVQATSPSVIPSGSPVRIVFTDAIGPSDTVALAPGIFRISPSVKGQTYWKKGGTMLEFLPREGAMKEGRTYRCTVAFSKFVAGGKDYSFTVKVEKPHCEIVRSEAVISGDDPSMCTLEVVVHFSKSVSPGDIPPSCVRVGAGASDVKIGKGDSPEEILITVNGVRRAPRNSTVDVSYDPGPNGIGEKVIAHIPLPGREAFQVTGALRNEEGEPYVAVRFSDPLSEEQSLEGLMYFEETAVTGIQKKESEVLLHYDKGGSPETLTLVVEGSVRNENGRSLSLPYRQAFVRKPLPPEVQIPISGNILPDPSDLRLPFRAVNLAAVDVEVFKIYAKNVLSFLQVAQLRDNYSYYLRRSGRVIYRRTARLDSDPELNLHAWNDFAVDLSGLFAQEKGAIYAIRLSFREEYSLYGRDLQDIDWEPIGERVASKGSLEWDDSVQWDDPYNRMYSEAFRWDERDDPTSHSYYLNTDHFPTINLTYSSIGVIAKTSERGTLWVSSVDINSARPAGGVHLTAYNYQLKAVGEGWSDENGHCDMALRSKAHFLVAERGNSVTYLDLSDSHRKDLSSFDVGGKKLEKGLKGYIYGERGVWRPGDVVHLTLALDGDKVPSSHPATLEIYTPEGTLWGKRTLKGGVNGFYCFSFETSPSAPTGRWKAVVSVGGASFSSSIPIETIKPNRLKVDIPDCPPSVRAAKGESGASLAAGERTPLGTLRARWLSGPPADGEDVRVDMLLSKMKAPFPLYRDYVFEDPLSDYSSSEHEVFSGKLDVEGKVSLMASLPPLGNVPGPLRAMLLAHVSESGGGESLGSRELRYDTFDSYTGVRLLSTQYDTDTDISIPVVVLDRDGRVLPGHDIQYRIYRLDWGWWWECSSSELSRYVHGKSAVVEAQGEVRTSSSSSSPSNIHFKVDYPDWGRFLLVATDPASGHTTGGVFTVDWPSWRGRSERGGAPSSAIIPFSLDSDSYEVGTDATVYVPQAEGGVALVSIEDGSQVLQRTWVRTSGSGETPFRFRVSAAMRPNVYVHLTLLQPRSAHVNDLPLRMYGVRKVKVTQKSSVLSPVIDVPASVSPQTEFTVKVRERDSRPMTYTLAIVDEGLLDITGFRTPDPWKAMNEVEALGVNTFDMYDNVVGAYGGKFSSVMRIGGDMALRGARRDNRFNPVVKFMGPFTLQGGSASHKVTLPMYVGSVRVMVVAGYGGAWGSADTTLAVKSPLMVIPTLPRALSCSDRVTMPVNVFMTEEAPKDVEVSISVDGPVKVEGQSTRTVRFTAPGDTLIRFSLICDPLREGTAGVKVKARSLSGEGLSASDEISISVRNPHPLHYFSSSVVLEGGESRTLGWDPFTPQDGEGVTVGLSTFPSIDFEKTFSFVCSYPHLCTEQLSSRLMNLLFTRKFLSEESRRKADAMIPGMIGELLTRQLYGGGFRYWASGKDPQHWASVMAAQCLLEARRQGFAVPLKALSLWADYARKEVRSYRHTSRGDLQDLVQAYRLWVLSEAGEGDIGAMNRLRESGDLSPQAVCCLGMAYVLEGKKKVAEELLSGLSLDTLPTAFSPGDTFRSRNRDRALMLEALCLLEMTGPALELATDLCKDFAASDPTTQEVGFTSMALSRLNSLVGGAGGTSTVRIAQEDCAEKAVSIDGGSFAMELDPGKGSVVLTNASPSGKVYLNLLGKQRPAATEMPEAQSSGVKVTVRYFDAKGKSKDVSELRQGEEFFAELTVSELTTVSASSHMALTFSLPHAWEVASSRLYSDSPGNEGDYTDIRDDSVRWYFSLPAGSQKTFRVRIRASYEGDFLLPQTVCEDMYNPRYRCMTEGGRVNVRMVGPVVSR